MFIHYLYILTFEFLCSGSNFEVGTGREEMKNNFEVGTGREEMKNNKTRVLRS